MREIKFRAWDKYTEIMYYSGPSHTVWVGGLCGRVVSNTGSVEISTEHIMQFTGLKDKNGKEIYEGDILGCETLKGVIPAWVIVYSNEYSGFRMRQVDRIKPVNIQNKNAFCRYPVIGNIYENPELLQS